MSDGSEFQVRGAATENARRTSSLRVLGTVSSGASDDYWGYPSIQSIATKALQDVLYENSRY